MLKISLAGASEEELERVVTRFCASYGAVSRVRIYLPGNASAARPFALVDMANPSEASALAAAAGRLTIGNAVVIFLRNEHAGAAPPRQSASTASGGGYPTLIVG